MSQDYTPKVWVSNPEYLHSDKFKMGLADMVNSGAFVNDATYNRALSGQVITDEALTRNMNTYQKAIFTQNQTEHLGDYKRKLIAEKEALENKYNSKKENVVDASNNNKYLLIGGVFFIILALLLYYFI